MPHILVHVGHFFLGWLPQDKQPILLNGPINMFTSLLNFVAASDAGTELGALFVNAKERKVLCLILKDMGHLQSHIPVHLIIPQPPELEMTLSRKSAQDPWK